MATRKRKKTGKRIISISVTGSQVPSNSSEDDVHSGESGRVQRKGMSFARAPSMPFWRGATMRLFTRQHKGDTDLLILHLLYCFPLFL